MGGGEQIVRIWRGADFIRRRSVWWVRNGGGGGGGEM